MIIQDKVMAKLLLKFSRIRFITFGIETWDKDIMLAKQKNNDIMLKALKVIKDTGIPDKDVQTDYLSVEPRYDNSYEKKDFIGYFIRNTFVVTLSDPEKVEELVTDVNQKLYSR
jgi:uncharacterized protein YggE